MVPCFVSAFTAFQTVLDLFLETLISLFKCSFLAALITFDNILQ
jgi:hypothetical protein